MRLRRTPHFDRKSRWGFSFRGGEYGWEGVNKRNPRLVGDSSHVCNFPPVRSHYGWDQIQEEVAHTPLGTEMY